jgi:LysM repeat protein
MGGKKLRRSNRRVFAIIIGLASCALLVTTAGALLAVTEEDIGASSPTEAAPSRPSNPEPSRPTNPGSLRPTDTQPASLPEPAYSPGHDATPNLSATASRAHPNFPYTIRPGDTLGSIAATFGMSVDDIAHANRMSPDADLSVGDNLRIPNPFVARERALIEEIDSIAAARQAAEQKAEKSDEAVTALRGQVDEMHAEKETTDHDLRVLPWWRALALSAAVAAFLMFGAMVMAVVEWWMLRSRFRAAAEMNESLRRLDYKYKAQLAKAELRMQELYGRRRRGIKDGQERTKLVEEGEIELLNRELKEILERHLERLKPPGEAARRARWRELIGGVGSPIEARSLRR